MTENTLAARPVGASRITLWRNLTSVFTMAAASDVLPVPAEPRIIITELPSRSSRKRLNTAVALAWSAVGTKPKVCII